VFPSYSTDKQQMTVLFIGTCMCGPDAARQMRTRTLGVRPTGPRMPGSMPAREVRGPQDAQAGKCARAWGARFCRTRKPASVPVRWVRKLAGRPGRERTRALGA